MLFGSRKRISCEKITLSKNLEENSNLKMGLKLSRIVWSNLGFLRRGWTTTCLKHDRTESVATELLMMDRMLGLTAPRTSLRRFVEMMSRGQVVGFIWAIISSSRDNVMRLKQTNTTVFADKTG